MNFDYYYGIEAEQFAFYRVPKILIKDKRFKGLSSDAKILYGLMLDRMALSMKNGWFDEENRVYIIYTIDSIMDDLGCAKATCVKIMAELDSKKGIGLIEKKKQGQGKPDLIYVKNFATLKTGETISSDTKGESVEFSEVQNLDFKKFRNCNSRSSEFEPLEVQKLERNYTDNINNTNISYNNQSINQTDNISDREIIDTIDDKTTYIELVKENISYDAYMGTLKDNDLELYKELYSIICDVVCVKRNTIRIEKQEYPYELVKARFLELNGSHLEYVMECVKNIKGNIGNIKAYLITTLYNSVNTIQSYYLQKQNAASEEQPREETLKNKRKNGFINYTQRTRNFEELERLEMELNEI